MKDQMVSNILGVSVISYQRSDGFKHMSWLLMLHDKVL